MIRKTLLVSVFIFIAGYCFSQQTVKPANDSTGKKGSHQIKTVNTKVIKLDKPVTDGNKPMPPMKTRQDTLRYLIQQHQQNNKNAK